MLQLTALPGWCLVAAWAVLDENKPLWCGVLPCCVVCICPLLPLLACRCLHAGAVAPPRAGGPGHLHRL